MFSTTLTVDMILNRIGIENTDSVELCEKKFQQLENIDPEDKCNLQSIFDLCRTRDFRMGPVFDQLRHAIAGLSQRELVEKVAEMLMSIGDPDDDVEVYAEKLDAVAEGINVSSLDKIIEGFT